MEAAISAWRVAETGCFRDKALRETDPRRMRRGSLDMEYRFLNRGNLQN